MSRYAPYQPKELATDTSLILDLDECLETTFCEQVCTNTFGSFECGCFPGYMLVNGTNMCRGT